MWPGEGMGCRVGGGSAGVSRGWCTRGRRGAGVRDGHACTCWGCVVLGLVDRELAGARLAARADSWH